MRRCLSGQCVKIAYYVRGNPDTDQYRCRAKAVGSVFKDDLNKMVKVLDAVCPLDNRQGKFSPGPQRPDRGHQLPGIHLIRPDALQPGTLVPEDCQETLRAMTVFDTGGRDHHG
jgi:hypothetical protein